MATKRQQGFQMTGVEPGDMPVKRSKLPGMAIPTEDFRHDGLQIWRHLPKIREGRIDIRRDPDRRPIPED